jgi:hypothetical protein
MEVEVQETQKEELRDRFGEFLASVIMQRPNVSLIADLLS